MAVRLGVVSQCYDPETGSAAVAGAICRFLAGAGYEVHVLTGFPNYPTGKVYPGYRMRLYQYENLAGVHVHRVPLVPSHDRSALRRAVTYLSFAASASTRVGLLRSVRVWLVMSSPATAAVPAMLARSLFRRPYILHIQDLWPQTVVESGFVRHHRVLDAMVRCLRAFCDASYRRASAVAVSAPGMADVLRGQGVRPDKLECVPNWVDETVFRPVPRDAALAAQLGLDGFVVMYAGSLGDLQGLETAIDAVRLLTDLPDVRLVFVGSGVAERRLAEAAADLPNVTFLGPQPVERMTELMALSDVQLVSLKDLRLFHTTLPSKVQATLAAGRPIIGAVAGDAARVIARSGAGFVVPPADAPALAAAVRRMRGLDRSAREDLGRAGHRYYLDHLSERAGGAALARLVQQAVEGSPHVS